MSLQDGVSRMHKSHGDRFMSFFRPNPALEALQWLLGWRVELSAKALGQYC